MQLRHVFTLSAFVVVSAFAPSALAAQATGAKPPAAPAAAPATSTVAPAAVAPLVTPAPGPAVTTDEEYSLKMRELEDMVSELKEQIFRSKAKLQLLAEQVAGGAGTGAKIVINHKNGLGGNFQITEASYYLDGQPLWQEVDDTGLKLTDKRDVPVWDGGIVEGSHTLTVRMVVRGNGSGVFKYLAAYKWTVPQSITFTAEPGKVLTIDSVAFEQGNFTTPLEERPAHRFDLNVSQDTRVQPPKEEAAKGAAQKSGAPAPTAGGPP